ncbi:hypothetical protein [Desulfosediminicola flagellatus]|uniref:hypothetical protein n=1 Tax=Desulfosediminicola flagellatus TaxID=2569541 RepID=UPI0010ABA5A7|nr:hypothetical protein [Desulfosediminicola flagellatus]
MAPEDMELLGNEDVEYKMKKIDFSYETDPAEIRVLLPRDAWAAMAQRSYVFQARKAEIISQIYAAQAEMLNEKIKIIEKYTR